MAILQMKRLSLAVVRSQKEELLKELIQHGCVEFSEIGGLVREAGIENLLKSESSRLMTRKSQLASLNHALAILDGAAPQKSSLLSAKPEIESSEFIDEKGLQSALDTAESIESNDDRIKRIAAEESRERSVIESLQPWLDFGMDLSCDGTARAAAVMGTIPSRISLDEVDAALAAVNEESELFRVNDDKAQHYVALVCIREALPALQEVLRGFGFTASAFSGMKGTARECIGQSQEALVALANEKQECTRAISLLADRREALKLAYEKINAKVSMCEAEEKLYGTDSTVLMEGWVPAEREEELAVVFDAYDCAWETRDPAEEEYPEVPVKLKNNKVTNALNMVTNMYSLPAYGTVDPNPLMAPFFILFYGLMMADIGYGIIMILAAIVAIKKIRPREGTLSFCQLLLYCGIATLAMGILTGGLFSDIPYQLVHLINPASTWEGLPSLFSPTRDSSLVLYGSMVLGALQLNTGMVVSFVQKVKAGQLADAIWYEGALWLILVTGVLAVLKIGFIGGIPVFLIAAVLMLLIGAGRGKKGFGKVTAAFAAIYNEATGWFGDVLSYARIMALMLAGGVVGQVFNTVAVMPAKSSGINVGTVLAFILIFLFGHAMNFALNILGCYVHDLRLQCLEYFGKFYVSGGKPFDPLRIKSRFINAKE